MDSNNKDELGEIGFHGILYSTKWCEEDIEKKIHENLSQQLIF
jgi:hypothetical protein